MFVKRIKVSNFKSFDDIDIEFGRFNVLIGANASGKSNLISIFQFLKNIAEDGLENAVSLQGGVQYLHNVNLGKANTKIELDIDVSTIMLRSGSFDKNTMTNDRFSDARNSF